MPKFDDLLESLLKEYTPVDLVPGYAGTGEETEAEFPEDSKGKYDLTSDETKHVAKSVISKLKDMDNHHFSGTYKEFQIDVIAPLIKALTGKSGTNSKYAARVVHKALKEAGIITDERGGKSGVKLEKTSPSKEEIEKVVASTEEIVDNGGEVETETEEETPTPEMKHTKFTPAGTYKLQDVAAGSLKGEAVPAYSALEHAGARDDIAGEDLFNTLKRKGITVSKIKQILNDFVRNEILVRTDEESSDEVGGGEALEAGADVRGLAKKHFESDPEMIAAYKDYLSSGGEHLSGREGDY